MRDFNFGFQGLTFIRSFTVISLIACTIPAFMFRIIGLSYLFIIHPFKSFITPSFSAFSCSPAYVPVTSLIVSQIL